MDLLETKTDKRPLVAVTVNLEHYGEWVRGAGGDVRLMTPGGNRSLDGVSGLLLTGGEDVDPALYGEVNRCSKRVNSERDRFELMLLDTALNRGLPILAICRGMQLLTVAFGGKLYQDLSECASELHGVEPLNHRGANRTDTTHMIEVEPMSLLSRCVGVSRLPVNSHHHQGIRILPPSLRTSGRSRDGLIEAVEHALDVFILALQWHPERWTHQSSVAIIRGFVDACGQRARGREPAEHSTATVEDGPSLCPTVVQPAVRCGNSCHWTAKGRSRGDEGSGKYN